MALLQLPRTRAGRHPAAGGPAPVPRWRPNNRPALSSTTPGRWGGGRAAGRRPVRLSGAGQGRVSQHRGRRRRRRRKSRSASPPPWRRPLGSQERAGRGGGGPGRRHLPLRPPQPQPAATPRRHPRPGCPRPSKAAGVGALPGRRATHQSPGGRLAPLGADWLSAAEVGGPGGRSRGSHIYRAALFKRRRCGRGGWRARGPLWRPLAREGLLGSPAERGEGAGAGVAAPGFSCRG